MQKFNSACMGKQELEKQKSGETSMSILAVSNNKIYQADSQQKIYDQKFYSAGTIKHEKIKIEVSKKPVFLAILFFWFRLPDWTWYCSDQRFLIVWTLLDW